jgi:hypothetical protein
MRAASGRFGLNLGRSNKDNSDKDGEPAQSGHGRVASGGGGANGGGLGAGELAKSVKGKIAHTTIVSIRAKTLLIHEQIRSIYAFSPSVHRIRLI